ncbi:MAG: hypothetical protein ACYDCN_05835 [Bacteroidia bacterium]
MKTKITLLLIVITSIAKQSYAQTDSTRHSENIYGNYYAPFHQSIKDTTHRTISDFGCYISAGIGGGSAYGIGGLSALLSASFAYKSLLFTVTRAGGASMTDGSDKSVYYQANYLGFLIGESVRFKHVMISLSAGIASANIRLRYLDVNAMSANTYVNPSYGNIISCPVELKIFIYARNGIGFGFHYSKNFLTPSQFSPYYYGICVVFGMWNKPKK